MLLGRPSIFTRFPCPNPISVLLWSWLEVFDREAETNHVPISLLCLKLDKGTGKFMKFSILTFMFGVLINFVVCLHM